MLHPSKEDDVRRIDDKDSFVTTSNFEPDYFTNTFGISYVLYDNENIAK